MIPAHQLFAKEDIKHNRTVVWEQQTGIKVYM